MGTQPYVTRIASYNDRYQPTQVDVVIPSAEAGLAGTYTTYFTYHVDGSPDSVAWTATADLPTEGLHYEYDPVLGLPLTLRSTLGTTPITYVTDTAYDALAQLEQITMRTSSSGDAVRLGYQRELETGRLTDSWVDLDNSPWVATDVRYSYDPAGNITKIQDVTANPDDTQCFGYDYLRRLTQAWTPGSGNCGAAPTTGGLDGPAPFWLSWTYDKVGNRLSQTDHRPTGNVATSYTYPPAGGPRPHTLTSATTGGVSRTWTYDAGGNTLTRPDNDGGQQTLTWDREARLSTVTDEEGTTRYIYDADGNRLIAREPDGKTLYLPGQEVRWDATTGTKKCTRYYDYHGQLIASRAADGLTWLAEDPQGTAQVAITDAGQQVQLRRQTPFGTPRGATSVWPNPKGFVGGDIDPTGMVHLGAREYDPDIGRFISIDPVMDLTDPQQIHGYAYANNNPVTWSDPTGLCIACMSLPDGGGKSQPVMLDYINAQNGGKGGGSSNPPPRPPAPPAGGGQEKPLWCAFAGFACTTDFGTQFVTGAGEHLTETLNGTWDMATDWFECMKQTPSPIVCDPTGAIVVGAAQDPGGTWSEYWHGMWDPIAEDWANGRYGEAAGRVAAMIAEAAIGGKGAGGLLKPSSLGAKFCSFSGSTLVLMADGTTKAISEIVPGDQVLAYNTGTGEQAAETVLAVWVHEDTLVELQVMESGRPVIGGLRAAGDATMATISTTADHPFWNHTDQQWKPAAVLSAGDHLLTADDTQATVIGVLPYRAREASAYNLTTSSSHTYYVIAGDAPVLVHNTGPCGPGALRINEGPVPEKVLNVLGRVDTKRSPLPGYKGGREFVNDGSQGASVLPRGNGVTYQEWDVNPKVKGVDRGGERLVTGSDGSAWYTNDHYQSFFRLR